jgi:two-component system sensor histidine kinase UhpB
MSLRFRLNLLISLLFALILLGGSVYVINNARNAVYNEVQSTAGFTLQLIEIAFANAEQQTGVDTQKKVLEQIANMEGIRHLQIELFRATNPDQNIPPGMVSPISAKAPQWFIKLVKPPPIEFRKVFTNPGLYYTEIIIRANPSDEISEVWEETKGVLILLLLFAVLANILVYVTLGRGLAPIDSILKGLDGIEQGDYRLRLPKFNLPELSRISDKFNHMAEVLQRSRDENQLLTQRSLAIQEDERRHLAQELHDELGQTITAIKAVAVSIENQPDMNKSSITNSAQTIVKFSNHMFDVAHNMIRRLRPVALDESGLVVALQNMVDDWNGRHADLFCHFNYEGKFNELEEKININLYRILQESLTNIDKHANATEVDIRLVRSGTDNKKYFPNQIYLTIHDDGVGFDLNVVTTGMGLLGMRERAEALGGEFVVQSAINGGVQLKVTIPVQNTVKKDE